MGAGSSSGRAVPATPSSVSSFRPESSASSARSMNPITIVGRSAGGIHTPIVLEAEDSPTQTSKKKTHFGELREEMDAEGHDGGQEQPEEQEHSQTNQGSTSALGRSLLQQTPKPWTAAGSDDGELTGAVWEWAGGDEDDETEEYFDEAQELVKAVRAAARQAGDGALRQMLTGISQGGRILKDDFCKGLSEWEWLNGKQGLVDRAGGYLFEALSNGFSYVLVDEAANYLSMNSRGNPLRLATARRGTKGGKIVEMERALEEAAVEVRKMRAASVFLREEAHTAAVKKLQLEEQLKAMAAGMEDLDDDEKQEMENKAMGVRRHLGKADKEARETLEKANETDRTLAGTLRWREYLRIELQQERAYAEHREMGLSQLAALLRRRENVRDNLRESAWEKGSQDPSRWADAVQADDPDHEDSERAEPEDAAGFPPADEESSDMMDGPELLSAITGVRCDVAALHDLLLPFAIQAFRRIETQHDTDVDTLHDMEKRLEVLKFAEQERKEAQAKLNKALVDIKRLEAESAEMKERIDKLEAEKQGIAEDRDKARDGQAAALKAEKEADARTKEAADRLAHAEALLTSLNTEVVDRRKEAFAAVQAAKEGRELVAELDALRRKEEAKWLEVQEEETKRQSKMLATRVNDYQANRLGKPPSGPRVFMSSTISDFRKERDEIKDYAMPKLQEFCHKRGMMLSVVDLRSGLSDADVTVGRMMPMFLKEIEQCQYYTCFLGQQTGVFPQNFSKGASRSQAKSFYTESCTEMEVNYILEKRLQWGGRAFFYLRDGRSVDDVTAEIDVPITDAMNESMIAMKQRISVSGLNMVVDYMSARDGVKAWMNDIMMMIGKDYPLDQDEFSHVPVGVEGWRPRMYLEYMEDKGHEAAFESRLSSYIRTATCERAVQAIRDHVEMQGGSPLLLTGPPGCGKATAMAVFMAQYKQELLTQDERALIAGISNRSLRATPVSLLRTMMRMIKTHFCIDTPGLPESEMDVLSHGALFSWLEMGGLEAAVVFCIDLDGFQGDAYASVQPVEEVGRTQSKASNIINDSGPWLGGNGVDMKWLTAAQPSGANLIVSASHPDTVRTAKEVYFWPCVEMTAMTREESMSLTNHWLGSRGLDLNENRSKQFWSMRQEEMGIPGFLMLFLAEWAMLDTVGWRHDAHIDKVLVIQSPSAGKSISLLYSLMMDRWEEEYEQTSVAIFGPVLSNLVLSRAGLTEAEILGITGIKPHDLGTFLATCRPILASKNGAYAITSQVIVQVIVHRYLPGFVEIQGGRILLIEYFRERGFGEDRTCFELPYQLRLANQFVELESVIQVLGVFRCFFSSGLEPELQAYWRLFTTEARVIADVYQKALISLEKRAAEGMEPKEQLRVYGVCLEGLESMAELLSQLARFLARSGQNLACIQMLERLVDVQERLRPSSSQLASAAHRLATQCWRIAYFEQGLPHVQKCLALQEHLHGRDSMQVSEASQLLALTLFGLNRLEEAEKAMHISLKLREQNVGRDHPSVAEALLHMGKILLRLGRMDESRDYQLRANKLMGARTRKSMKQAKNAEDKEAQEKERLERAETAGSQETQ